MDSSQSQPVKEQKIEMKKQEKNNGLPPKIPTMITKPNIKRELPKEEQPMAQPSSSKEKGVVLEGSMKTEVDVDDKSLISMIDDSELAQKREKRLLANRLSAQRSRLKKVRYTNELETNAQALEDEIKILTPQLCYHDNQRRILNAENRAIRQRMAVLINNKVYKDAEFEAMKNEKKNLRQLTLLQQQQLEEQQLQQQQFTFEMDWEELDQAAEGMNFSSNPIYDWLQ